LTQACKICDLHPLLLDWVDKLLLEKHSLQEIIRRLNTHGLNIDYQTVQDHKKHRESASVHRMHIQMGSRKQEPMSILQKLDKYKRQLKEFESWIKAESNPPLEAENAYAVLHAEVMRLELLLKS